jgi:hypothetical protein
MTDFLDLVKSIDGDVRDARTIFSSREDGANIKAGMTIEKSRVGNVKYTEKLTKALQLVTEVLNGTRNTMFLQEVMTTDDFPLYFGDILDRALLSRYTNWPVTWTSYARRATVKDFRDAKLIPQVYGADGPLDVVEEAAPYPDAALTEQEPILWSVKKYGRRVPISWETTINDDLDQFRDIPERLATAARRTEQRLVTLKFVDASGPHASLYTAGNANIINTTNGSLNGNNPPLTVSGLQSALNVLSRMVDETGEPILRTMATLVVPPALFVTARQILNSTALWDSTVIGGANPPNPATAGERQLQTTNWMRDIITNLVVDPYIKTYATSANGDTSWFLFSNPNEGREAIRIGFLRGHESPEIWMKSPNARRVGGGEVSPLSGDFDTDSIEYRVRHVTGVTVVDPKSTVASNGSGS